MPDPVRGTTPASALFAWLKPSSYEGGAIPAPLRAENAAASIQANETNSTVPLLTSHLSFLTGTCYFLPGSNPLACFGEDGRWTHVTQDFGTDGFNVGAVRDEDDADGISPTRSYGNHRIRITTFHRIKRK